MTDWNCFMNITDAAAVQRALDAAYAPLAFTPLPEVYESNTLYAWAMWDAAVREQDIPGTIS
jgi:hypothetical protein